MTAQLNDGVNKYAPLKAMECLVSGLNHIHLFVDRISGNMILNFINYNAGRSRVVHLD